MNKELTKVTLEFNKKEYEAVSKFTDKIENADILLQVDVAKILKKTILEHIGYSKRKKKNENIENTLKRIEDNIDRIDANIGNIYKKIYKNQNNISSISTKSSDKYNQYYIEIPTGNYYHTLDNMYKIPVDDILYFEIIYKYREACISATLPNLDDISIRLYYYDENGLIEDLSVSINELIKEDISINRKLSIVQHLYNMDKLIVDKYGKNLIRTYRKIYKQSIDQIIETTIWIVKKTISHIDEDTNQLFFKTDCDSKNISIKVKKELDNDDIFKKIAKEWNKDLNPDIELTFEDATKEVNLNPLVIEKLYQNQIQKDYENLFEDNEPGGVVFNFYPNEDLKSEPFKIRLDRFVGLEIKKVYKENSDKIRMNGIDDIDSLLFIFHFYVKNNGVIQLRDETIYIDFKNMNKKHTYYCFFIDFLNTIKETYKDHLIYIEKENIENNSHYYLLMVKDWIKELYLDNETIYMNLITLFNKYKLVLYSILYKELVKILKVDKEFEIINDKIVKKNQVDFSPSMDLKINKKKR